MNHTNRWQVLPTLIACSAGPKGLAAGIGRKGLDARVECYIVGKLRKWSKSEYQFGTTSMRCVCLNVPDGCQACGKSAGSSRSTRAAAGSSPVPDPTDPYRGFTHLRFSRGDASRWVRDAGIDRIALPPNPKQ